MKSTITRDKQWSPVMKAAIRITLLSDCRGIAIALYDHEKRGPIWSINDAKFAKANFLVTPDRPEVGRCRIGLNLGHSRIPKEKLDELLDHRGSYAFSQILGIPEELVDSNGARICFVRPPTRSLLCHYNVGLDESNRNSVEVGEIGTYT